MTEADNNDPKTAIKHLVWAAIPSLVAAVAVLIQLLEPYIATTHQSLLWGTAAFCGNITLATWLWCALVRLLKRTNTTNVHLAHITTIVEHNDKALQGVHRRLSEQDEEISHLRKLLLGDTYATGGVGPSPYS